jgi:Lrp/AsnC family leucine-responsive transcriptional regulator
MSKITIDRYDLALLDALQRKGNATNATLGEQINLSASQISRRIQRLEEDGIIAGYVALLAPAALGLGVTAFAQVILERHGDNASETFESAIAAMPEVWTATRSAVTPTTCCASSSRIWRRSRI